MSTARIAVLTLLAMTTLRLVAASIALLGGIALVVMEKQDASGGRQIGPADAAQGRG